MSQISNFSTKNELPVFPSEEEPKSVSQPIMVGLSSGLERLNPEVQKKVIEQVPEVGLTARTAIGGIQSVHNRCMNSNDDSQKSCYEIIGGNADTFRKLAQKDNISSEERQRYIEGMQQCAQMAIKKDTENKEYNLIQTDKTIKGILIGAGLVVASLGFTIVLRKPVKL